MSLTRVLRSFFIEFLISDLALASHGIPSFTLSSLSLLSSVLESHPPSAVITHASFLPHLLELIYDSAEHEHHTIIVVGQPAGGIGLEKMKDHVNVVSWNELESEGSKIDQVVSAAPGKLVSFLSKKSLN
jgi:long-chain acyl-CoA synthetase